MKITDIATISCEDVVNTLKHWEKEESEETLVPILYFASELTGISIDELYGAMQR